MRRVAIVGCGGAGKSTLACAIGERTGLPVVHLDLHFWNDGWVETGRDRWAEQVDRLIAPDRWVVDGNYGRTMERRLAVLRRIESVADGRRIEVLRGPRDVTRFLETL